MPRKRHKPEEIVAKIRQVGVLATQGQLPQEAGPEYLGFQSASIHAQHCTASVAVDTHRENAATYLVR